jgi:sugar porter (SP) family MFS transporter
MKVRIMQPGGKSYFYVTLVAACTAIAGLLFGYDVAVINGALVYLRADFHLGPVATEFLTAILFVGCAFGSLLFGWASDRFGRRAALFCAGLLFCVAAFTASSSAQIAQLMIARFFAGVAIGATLLVAPLYISEISPAHKRGMLVTLNQLLIVIGTLAGFIVSYELAKFAPGSWRLMFFIGGTPAIALCLAMLWIPESPRWLLQKGRVEQATAVLRKVSDEADVQSTIDEITNAIREESGTYRELLSKALRKPLVLAVMLAIIQQITGVNTVLYYGSIIFAENTGASASQAIGMNVVVGAVNLLFTVFGLLLIDKLGRRPLLLLATGGMAVSLVAFAILLNTSAGHSSLLLLPVLAYVACFAFGLGTGVWVCMAELFPNRIRGRALSISNMALWISVTVLTATFLSLTKMFSAAGVFMGYAVICVLSFIYIYIKLPETKNRTLEEIEASWSK